MTERKEHSITQLKQGETATVAALHGGHAMQQRLRSVGINEGKKVRVVANHPFSGPLVVQAGGRQITLGRGMARRIIVTPEQ
jgi:ferrous iron transport protein A